MLVGTRACSWLLLAGTMACLVEEVAPSFLVDAASLSARLAPSRSAVQVLLLIVLDSLLYLRDCEKSGTASASTEKKVLGH